MKHSKGDLVRISFRMEERVVCALRQRGNSLVWSGLIKTILTIVIDSEGKVLHVFGPVWPKPEKSVLVDGA